MITTKTSSTSLASETAKLIQEHMIPCEWNDAVVEQAQHFDDKVAKDDKQHRFDLREVKLVTIDGEDARDFDDAIHAKPNGDGWLLTVAIADVSHYVSIHSAIDQEAALRGNSVYFAHTVIPMLPEVLSNGLCSLNPQVDRLSMAVDIQIDQQGIIQSYQFYEALIRSHARLTYTEVGQYIADSESFLSENASKSASKNTSKNKTSALVGVRQQIDHLLEVFEALRHARSLRGAMDFETRETRVIFADDLKIEKIVPVQRNPAHQLVEEAMLAANMCTADLFLQQKIPAMFRNHMTPTQEKLDALRDFLATQGLQLTGGDNPQPSDFQLLGQKAKQRANRHIIFNMMLRSQQQAVYEAQSEGHFGLALAAYTHFTSPIRRYPDLLVHRAIRNLIRSDKACNAVARIDSAPSLKKVQIYPYSQAELDQSGEHCSFTERRAEEATRNLMQWLKCEYLQQHLGQHFKGTISTVTAFGLFIELDDLYVDGLLHISNLRSDYYDFDSARHCLEGRSRGQKYSQGDSIEIQVAAVNMTDRKIDFLLSEQQRPKGNKKSKLRDGKVDPWKRSAKKDKFKKDGSKKNKFKRK